MTGILIGGGAMTMASALHVGTVFAILVFEIIVIGYAFIARKYFVAEMEKLFRWLLLGTVLYMINTALHFVREFYEMPKIMPYEHFFALLAFIAFILAALTITETAEKYGLGGGGVEKIKKTLRRIFRGKIK